MTTLAASLAQLSNGSPQQYEHLTIFPFLDPMAREPFYLTLEEALTQGVARITEVSKGGNVQELLFINAGDRPVLLLDGEELLGAKQNRVLNLTILALAHSDLTIPVSCVEQGRWHETSATFAPSPHWHHHTGRRDRVETVSAAMESGHGALADQERVWQHIGHMAEHLHVNSPTHAMADVFEQLGPRLDAYVHAFTAISGQTGALFALGGRMAGLEVVYSQATFAQILPKLVRSYALDAIQCGETSPASPSQDDAAAFLQQVVHAKEERFPGIGSGESVRLHDRTLVGAGLVVEEALLHLAAFRKDGGAGTSAPAMHTRFLRASNRFRR